jgi:hypoxanthine phosphoribosyltransferase
MKNLRFEKVSWDQYQRICFSLAKAVNKKRIDYIVAISRGGLIASRILSDILNLPISHITIISYQDLKQQKEIRITETPSRLFDNQTILLVDEIADSGKTFKRALEYFRKFKNCTIYTLALYVKPHTTPVPDFWAKKTDAWVIFPYELQETYQAFKKLYKSKAKEKLLEVGFKKWEIQSLDYREV